jgi:hypothetical protein
VAFALVFSFWPDNDTVHTGPNANLPEAERTVPNTPQPPRQ